MKEKMECFVPEIRIPEWLVTYAEKLYGQPLPSPEERVRLTVELAAENVRRGTAARSPPPSSTAKTAGSTRSGSTSC